MRHAIKIVPQSLPLITMLNKGVTPEIEAEPTWFVFYAPEHPRYNSVIMTQDEISRTTMSAPIPEIHCLYNQ